jgi:hypothetical protein
MQLPNHTSLIHTNMSIYRHIHTLTVCSVPHFETHVLACICAYLVHILCISCAYHDHMMIVCVYLRVFACIDAPSNFGCKKYIQDTSIHAYTDKIHTSYISDTYNDFE